MGIFTYVLSDCIQLLNMFESCFTFAEQETLKKFVGLYKGNI